MSTANAPSPLAKAVSISDQHETIPIPPTSTPTSAAPRRAPVTKPLSASRRRVPPSPALAPIILTRDVVPRVSLTDRRPSGSDADVSTAADTPGSENTGSTQKLNDYFSAHPFTSAQALPSNLIGGIREWISAERQRRHSRRERKRERKLEKQKQQGDKAEADSHSEDSANESLDALEALLAETPAIASAQSQRRSGRSTPRRKKSLSNITPLAGSDTEYASDGEALVPTCEVYLGTSEEIGMEQFKEEVLKLTHTLKCKGWRRVELDRHQEIKVHRISGALTNAVYMVSPPNDVPPPSGQTSAYNSSSSVNLVGKPSKFPKPLLLRIYGPQVAHLIDRDTELSILRRLARKKIGPRLLGTFTNGRFEEFFPSSTLTKTDIRQPATSRHIAKRLKELHLGISVLPAERTAGAMVWRNWQKWTARCSDVISRYESHAPGSAAQLLGTKDWTTFAAAVEAYRLWLLTQYGGTEETLNNLVFAHNDTQYGNILRLETHTQSPLLLPSNEHRQLVVIDFEYASANTASFEFANHFCEWMSDYHNATAPYAIHTRCYPTLKEQRNFVEAYVRHSLKPAQPAKVGSGGEFDLDGPADGKEAEEIEKRREEAVQKEVEKWMLETRWWRPACHAQWAAWGIVQAKDEFKAEASEPSQSKVEGIEGSLDAEDQKAEEKVEEEDAEFDYFAYAHEKVGLFWSDLEALGILMKPATTATDGIVVDEKGVWGEVPKWAKRIVEA